MGITRREYAGYIAFLKGCNGRYWESGRPDPECRHSRRIMQADKIWGSPHPYIPGMKGHAATIRLHQTDVVIYWEDGTYAVNAAGWHTNITKAAISAHTPLCIWTNRGTQFISQRYYSDTIGSEGRDHCTYWFSHPPKHYQQFAPREGKATMWGSGSAIFYAGKQKRIVRDILGKPLLSVARQKEIDAELKRRRHVKSEQRARVVQRLRYYIKQFAKLPASLITPAMIEKLDGMSYLRSEYMEAMRESACYKAKAEETAKAFAGILKAKRITDADNKLMVQKLHEYQARLAFCRRLELFVDIDDDLERSRLIQLYEEVLNGHVREETAGAT